MQPRRREADLGCAQDNSGSEQPRQLPRARPPRDEALEVGMDSAELRSYDALAGSSVMAAARAEPPRTRRGRRRLAALGVTGLVAAAAGVAFAAPASAATFTVAADGTAQFRTVQAAVNAVPANNTSRATITIKPGTYREIVTVPANKPFVTFQGLGTAPSQVLIVNNHWGGDFGTFNSASVFVNGHDFIATNLTISNDFDESSRDTGGQNQAVALNLNADRSTLSNVRLLGDQDTFLVNASARAYIVNSYVEGTVDFVFGDGTAVINNSELHEKPRGGAFTAARTPANHTYGFLIYKSRVTGAAANGSTSLGRSWGPAAQVLFRESTLAAVVNTAQPWANLGSVSWQGARFSEYRNTGAGATVNGNRPQLSDAQAPNFTPQKYLAGSDGWNPVG
jgi:pectin methylesterase-like acyl-CoA thioesterase